MLKKLCVCLLACYDQYYDVAKAHLPTSKTRSGRGVPQLAGRPLNTRDPERLAGSRKQHNDWLNLFVRVILSNKLFIYNCCTGGPLSQNKFARTVFWRCHEASLNCDILWRLLRVPFFRYQSIQNGVRPKTPYPTPVVLLDRRSVKRGGSSRGYQPMWVFFSQTEFCKKLVGFRLLFHVVLKQVSFESASWSCEFPSLWEGCAAQRPPQKCLLWSRPDLKQLMITYAQVPHKVCSTSRISRIGVFCCIDIVGQRTCWRGSIFPNLWCNVTFGSTFPLLRRPNLGFCWIAFFVGCEWTNEVSVQHKVCGIGSSKLTYGMHIIKYIYIYISVCVCWWGRVLFICPEAMGFDACTLSLSILSHSHSHVTLFNKKLGRQVAFRQASLITRKTIMSLLTYSRIFFPVATQDLWKH